MSDFFKQFNSKLASEYRKLVGGKGYVFQDRYKSTIIQNEGYLMIVIAYTLNNPVRAKLAQNFLDYQWSSASLHFNNQDESVIDTEFVEEIFGSKANFVNFVHEWQTRKLPMIKTEEGLIIGGEEFHSNADKLQVRVLVNNFLAKKQENYL